MLESGSSGSVRGASRNGRPYREPGPIWPVRQAAGDCPLLARSGRLGSDVKRTLHTASMDVAVGRILALAGGRRRLVCALVQTDLGRFGSRSTLRR